MDCRYDPVILFNNAYVSWVILITFWSCPSINCTRLILVYCVLTSTVTHLHYLHSDCVNLLQCILNSLFTLSKCIHFHQKPTSSEFCYISHYKFPLPLIPELLLTNHSSARSFLFFRLEIVVLPTFVLTLIRCQQEKSGLGLLHLKFPPRCSWLSHHLM